MYYGKTKLIKYDEKDYSKFWEIAGYAITIAVMFFAWYFCIILLFGVTG